MAVFCAEFCVPAVLGNVLFADAPVLFRSGHYDLPADAGGPFDMTPDELRAAAKAFPKEGVPLTNEHNRTCIFNGKLGRVLSVRTSPDGTVLAGKIALARPVRDLLGPGPIKLSANWDRTTKMLRDVSLTGKPRIEDAALFAAFAKKDDDEMIPPAPAPDVAPATPALDALGGAPGEEPPAEGEATEAGPPTGGGGTPRLIIEGPAEELMTLRRLCEKMGLTCKDAVSFSAPSPASAPVRPKSPYEVALEARVRDLERAQRTAQFSAHLATKERDISAFLQEVRDRTYPAQRAALEADLRQRAVDDLMHPAEVQFSNGEGAAVRGSRLDAGMALIRSTPPHGLFTEQLAPGAGARSPFAQYSNVTQTADAAAVGRLTQEQHDELLGYSSLGQQVLRDKNNAQGSRNNGNGQGRK